MISVFARSIASLKHKAIWWMLFASIAASVIAIFILMWLTDYLITTYQLININWIETILEKYGFIAASIIGWFLFPVLVPAVAGLFEDKAAELVERNEYGLFENAQKYPWYKEIRFLLLGLLLNLVLLPIYLVPVLNLFVYYLVNSFLVGKGVFMLVASRYFGHQKAAQVYAKHNLKIKLYGLVLAFMSNMPIINLIAPLFAIIVMVHYSKSIAFQHV
jgi:CysZ protein